MIEVFSDLPEALENNFNLPFRCNFKPNSSLPILPNIRTNEKIDVDQELINLASKGLKEKFNEYILKKKSDQINKKNIAIFKK